MKPCEDGDDLVVLDETDYDDSTGEMVRVIVISKPEHLTVLRRSWQIIADAAFEFLNNPPFTQLFNIFGNIPSGEPNKSWLCYCFAHAFMTSKSKFAYAMVYRMLITKLQEFNEPVR